MLQRLAFQKLHGDESLPLLLADVVDGADVRVIEGGRGLRLASETGQRLKVSGNFFRQEFEGDETVQARVFGLVDHTHPTAAEFLQDAVVRDGLAEHRRNAMAYGFGSQRWWTVGSPSAPPPRLVYDFETGTG